MDGSRMVQIFEVIETLVGERTALVNLVELTFRLVPVINHHVLTGAPLAVRFGSSHGQRSAVLRQDDSFHTPIAGAGAIGWP